MSSVLPTPVLPTPGRNINRGHFPDDFIFGAGTSSYQIEGAAREGGRGPSIWDTFTHTHPELIQDGSNGDTAINSYNLYKEDIKIVKLMGLDAYRFSISWPRILPGGNINAGINQEGIKYYNNLIDELLANDIVPYVTLFHWDVPQALQDQYDGFLSDKIVDDFRDFAELCFWEFGDRVKNWITINEPQSYSDFFGVAYDTPPKAHALKASRLLVPTTVARPSKPVRVFASTADPGTTTADQVYKVGHNLLLAHAAAIQVYRDKFQNTQEGTFGMALVTQWMKPLNENNPADVEAASRAFDFKFGWFMQPLITGEYPKSMRQLLGPRLREFTPDQKKLLIGSYDYVGVNYYTATYVSSAQPPHDKKKAVFHTDGNFYTTDSKDGVLIGPLAGPAWLNIVPEGIYHVLHDIKENYEDPVIYITENGVYEVNDTAKTLSEARVDTTRLHYLQDHLSKVLEARHQGVRVQGYLVWSLMDNWELRAGYTSRFGLIHVDYYNNFARYPKDSAIWFRNAFHKRLRIHVNKARPQEDDGAFDTPRKRLRKY
uniref:Beta-glucosidase n=1 Tax=Carapichea ipecacuanha TaxID=77880 RepID=B6ZKM6_CARIP|nr:beta-glucosidase [Carapichea ipecacuanha]